MRIFFPGDITEKRRSTILAFSKIFAPGSKHQRKMNSSFLVHRSARNHKQTFWKKNIELEKVNGIVEKLDVHYGFFMLKNCFSLPKLLYFLRTSTSFNHPALFEKYDKTVRNGLSKVCNVNFHEYFEYSAGSEMGGLGVSSILALPAFFGLSFWCE